MYGEKPLEKERIGISQLLFEKIEEGVYKIRVSTPYREEELVVPVAKGKELRLYPVLPIHTPKPITTHILYALNPPLMLAPGERINATLETMLEIGVALYSPRDGRRVEYVYFIPPKKMKYALYGSPENGVIARLNHTPIHIADPLSLNVPDYTALTKISLRNYSDETVRIERILVDGAHMNVYYDSFDRAYTNELEMAVLTRNKGHVIVTKRVPLPGLTRSVDPVSANSKFLDPFMPIEGFYKDERKTAMRLGFRRWIPRH